MRKGKAMLSVALAAAMTLGRGCRLIANFGIPSSN